MHDLATLMNALAPVEGMNTTFLPEISVFRGNNHPEAVPFHYEQGLYFVGRGRERVYFENKPYDYDPSNYLVVSVPISAIGEVLINEDGPLLAVAIDINHDTLGAILQKMKTVNFECVEQPAAESKGLFVPPRSVEIDQTLSRLLQALHSPIEASVVGPLLLEELLFRVLVSDKGSMLADLVKKNSSLAKMESVLNWLRVAYANKIGVEDMASRVNMSPSVFHRTFKDLTAKSPIQYLKSLRLAKGRELMALHGLGVGEAAHKVGYESASQFSREFKRAYGVPPKDAKSSHHGFQPINSQAL